MVSDKIQFFVLFFLKSCSCPELSFCVHVHEIKCTSAFFSTLGLGIEFSLALIWFCASFISCVNAERLSHHSDTFPV